MLKLNGITKIFGGLTALEDVSFSVADGSITGVIGPNGAGKTTLFNIISGQIRASSGEIWLFGQNVSRMPSYRRAALGLARTFQITSLFPRLTVRENMTIAVQALQPYRYAFHKRVAGLADLNRRTRDLLERWSLWDHAEDQVRNLSYGIQRQLEIVMALAGAPKLLMLDEPTAGLSAMETHLAADIIMKLDRSITILLIEHDLPTAFRLADSVTAMDQGRIVAEGTPAEIRKEASINRIYMRGSALAQPGGGAG